jgi:lipoyl(octanoyl) transferase
MKTSQGTGDRSLAVWLAGCTGWEGYAALAERMAGEVMEPGGRPPTLVLYEPAPAVTIGRLGSRTDVELSDDDLRARRMEIRFVGRGGGAVLHGPGQVGIALFARLADLGLERNDVGGYIDRFEGAIEAAVRMLRCAAARDSRAAGVFGRTGLLAAVGVAIRRGVTWHGGFLNVQASSLPAHRVHSVPLVPGLEMRTMSAVETDVRRKVRLQDARSAIVRSLVDAFGFSEAHVQSGFPVPICEPRPPEAVSRVG